VTPAFRYTLLWIGGSIVMLAAAMNSLSLSYADGQYLPGNTDAFYHARRILDSVMSGAPVIEFDPFIHAPEGSWLTWPWGYDTLLARIVSLFGPFASEAQANRVLMNLPVAAAPIAVALVVMIARQLALPGLYAALLVFGFAFLPISFMLFTVGNIDHHFAELIFTLATLASGVWFFREDSKSPAAPILLGFVLGGALAIHNGLFILQIPVVATFVWRWLRAEPLPSVQRTRLFGGALMFAALAACLPSEPLRHGFFEFYTLSWFHVYVTACATAVVVTLSTVARTRTRIQMLAAFAVVAALPILGSMLLAGQFVTGDLEAIENILEVYSPYKLWWVYGGVTSTRMYSWLMWLMFPALLVNLWWAVRVRDRSLQYCAVFGVFVLALMQLQFRFGVFGLMSLLLTCVLFAKRAAQQWPARRNIIAASAVALFGVSYMPTVGIWSQRWLLTASIAYDDIRSVFPVMKEACARHPGIVLADSDDGHWVRYHSKCSVIADPFLLTPQHAAKLRQSENLMKLAPLTLLQQDKLVSYVFVHHALKMHPILRPGDPELPNLEEWRARLPLLEGSLLGPQYSIPRQFHLLWEKKTPGGQVYGRLYEVRRDP